MVVCQVLKIPGILHNCILSIPDFYYFTNQIKKMTIIEFNKLIEYEYEYEYSINDIHIKNNDWFPLMKYDEDYGVSKPFDDINILTVGLNPSLTEKSAQKIHHEILGIQNYYSFANKLKFGNERYEAYSINKIEITKKMIEFQYNLKYLDQIQYFKLIDEFCTEISGKNSTFKNNVFHYDFCQMRETDSRKMKSVTKENYIVLREHFVKIIEMVQPKVIFIFNGFLSSLLLENNFFTQNDPDKNEGCYFLNDNGNTPKIVLSNQLSGGATSKVHKKMLIWHGKRLLGGISSE